MKEKDVIDVLQFYRHEMMNELQIISGYLSMDKLDNVKKKFEELLFFYEEERKLMCLNAPKFTLWVIRFNNLYDNFRLTYKISEENIQLFKFDDILIKQCKKVMGFFSEICHLSKLYEVNLDLKKREHSSNIEVNFSIDAFFEADNGMKIYRDLENEIQFFKRENRLESRFLIQID